MLAEHGVDGVFFWIGLMMEVISSSGWMVGIGRWRHLDELDISCFRVYQFFEIFMWQLTGTKRTLG